MRRSWSASALLLLLALLLLSCLPYALPATTKKASTTRLNRKAPICIIGAGASGLASGLRLQGKGYTNILILEKEAIPGGKARTVIAPDLLSYPMGAVFTVEINYESIRLLNEYGVQTFPDPLDAALFDPDNGATVPQPAYNESEIQTAIKRYAAKRRGYLPYLVPGYVNGVPPDLLVSSYDWIEANNLQILWEGITSYVTLFGYGSLSKLPAIYLLNALDEVALVSAYDKSLRLLTDWGELWTRISWNFNIRYNVDILDVQRRNGTGKAITIHYRMPIKGKIRQFTANCRSVIVAIPSTLEKLTRFNLDARETRVFSQVRHINYYTGLVNLPQSNLTSFLGFLQTFDPNDPKPTAFGSAGPRPPAGYIYVEPPSDGRPMLYTFFGAYAESKYTVYYAYKDGQPLTLAEFEALGLQSMSLVNHPINSPPPGAPLSPSDFVRSFAWYYFPYFNNDTITPTIFYELEALQGYRNTFWLSSLRCFENMSEIIKSAYDIVDRFF